MGIQKRLSQLKTHPEEGMTLVEALVAVIIVTIIFLAATPPLFVGMASRVLNRRAETAMNIAQQEVEQMRLLMESGEYVTADLPPADTSISHPNDIQNAAAPTSICAYPCASYALTQARETANGEFLIQTFREPGVVSGGQVIIFRMGVRVYSKKVRDSMGSLETEMISSHYNLVPEAEQHRTNPLVVLYVDLAKGDLVDTLDRYRDFLK